MRLIKGYTFTGAMSSVLMFNMLLNAAVPFETVIWDGVTLAVWLNACFMMAVFITAVVCVSLPMLSTKKCIPHIANGVSIVGAVLIALIAQLFPSTDAPQWVIIVLPAFAAVMGVGSGLQQTHMFNICALWPEDMIILASSSGGFGGIYSFTVFTILSNIFSISLSSQQALVWAQFAFGMVVPLLNSVVWFVLAPREVTSRSLAKLTDEQVNVIEEGETLVAPKKWYELLKANSLSLFNAVFVLVVSFSLFPGVAPLSFGYSYTWTSVFIGLWQVLDTIFRYIPAFGWFPKLNRNFWLVLVLVRAVLFIPLFVVPVRGNMLPEWAMVIGFVLFVATNSLTATVMNHDFVVRVDTPADIKLTSGLLIAGCNGGVFLGSLIANLYTL
ncbi:MAG: hypothetical protein KVP17_003926 [Porospora cf. gigantea B]|uniref:uncharacterized protein n=1 Tax=Porospora cf. gigantea B TaxID=2853592 RepID=UPI003571E652|nr:MAG: hypothetical protein KVP17_003926 [Porospora cf. gigantea B]